MLTLKKIGLFVFRRYGVRANVVVGKNFHIGILSRIEATRQLTIGDNVYVGKMCTIECNGSIGDNCLIANNVGIIGRYDHDYTVIGRPMRFAPWIGDPDFSICPAKTIVNIGEDVWIGFGAIILSGLTIGRGAIIAAGSIVTKDVAPYSIVAGCPAKHHGQRFTKEQILEHEKIIYTKKFEQ